MIRLRFLFPFATLILLSAVSRAALESVTLSSEDRLPAPRWIYGIGEIPKTGLDATTLTLAKVKEAQVRGDDVACVDLARAAKAKAKALQAWLSVVELECALHMKPSPKAASALSRSLEDIAKIKEWFVVGPQVSRLKTAFSAGLVSSIEQDLNVNRARAWRSIERIDEFSNLLSDQTRAFGLRSAGELSVIQLKPEAARDFFKRSLLISDNPETRARLKSLEASLGVGSKKAVTMPTPLPSESQGLSESDEAVLSISNEASPEELDLALRTTAALKSGDLVVAVEDAIQIVKKFPGGTRAKWATDRIQESLNTFAERTDIKYQDIHDQIMNRVEEADADRLTGWATVLYNRGQFADSFRLVRKALVTIDGSRRTRALELAGEAALAVENWDVARDSFKELIERSAGQPVSREALFRLGLLDYRQKNYSAAISEFERLLALPQTENLEVGARYWLWRSLQKTKSERASKVSEELMTRFPFSYYGLRARLEAGGGTLEWKNDDKSKIESVLWLTANEKMAWEKAQILLRAGWLDEAQSEIRELPSPVKAEDKALRALLHAAAGSYVTSSRLANEAWDEKSELRRAPLTDAVFPKDFTEFIEAQSKRRNVESDLIRSLIKQESSFNVRATSTSNAYGLMQMIPPTAREIAQDLKLGPLKLPDDMFNTKRNIEMGTYYLSRMISRNSGHIPLALANYNAGPARIDRWLRSRASLKTLAASRSSAPDDEIWIDEIPYTETCFYVKAILRNVMLIDCSIKVAL